jgi:hypothetical protein
MISRQVATLAAGLLMGSATIAVAQQQPPSQAEGQAKPRRSATQKPEAAKPRPAAKESAPAETAAQGAKAQGQQRSKDAKSSQDPRGKDAKGQDAKGQDKAKSNKTGSTRSEGADGDAKAGASGKGGARSASAEKAKTTASTGKAMLLDTFGDWKAYATQSGRTKTCYALTEPKDRQPKTRDAGYLFVSFKPSENVRNEVSFVMGFPVKDNGEAEAIIGKDTFAFVTKDQTAWMNPAQESQFVATLVKGGSLTLKASSRKGSATTDRYSLTGFGQALERVRKECS